MAQVWHIIRALARGLRPALTRHCHTTHSPPHSPPLVQLEVLEPATLLLRQMPRFRGASLLDVGGRAFEDLSQFLHYRCAPRV